jgi:hypothetical protein
VLSDSKEVATRPQPRSKVGWIVALAALVIALSATYFWMKDVNETGKPYRTITDQSELEDVTWHENTITITDRELTDESLSEFLNDHRIEDLTIDRCGNVTEAGLQGLERSDKLTHVNASYTSIGDDVSEILVHLHKLEYLSFKYSKVTELSAEVFESNERLLTLEFAGCRVTRKLLERCAAHPQLRSLNLSSCTGVLPDDFAVLARSKSLRRVYLDGNDVSHAAVSELCSMESLQVLSIPDKIDITKLKSKHPEIEFR